MTDRPTNVPSDTMGNKGLPTLELPAWCGRDIDIPDPKARGWPITRDTVIRFMADLKCLRCGRSAKDHVRGKCLLDHTWLELPGDPEAQFIEMFRHESWVEDVDERQSQPGWTEEFGDGLDDGTSADDPEPPTDEGVAADAGEPFETASFDPPRFERVVIREPRRAWFEEHDDIGEVIWIEKGTAPPTSKSD